MDLGLTGANALITGASRGIGFAIATQLVAEGANVAICGRDENQLAEAAEKLTTQGPGRVHATPVDVSDADQINRWVTSAADDLAGLDIVVSNVSGMGGPGLEAWERNFRIDVLGFHHLMVAAHPHLQKSSRASVIALGTTAATETFGDPTVAYGSLKAALIHQISGYAQKWAGEGIRCNAVSPGPVLFEGGAWDTVRTNNPEMFERILGMIPRGSMASPQEIASVVTFLSSPAASIITGVNVVADGGFTKMVKF
ncbi:SDR family NAD(P)-dependent oxidoreductase [Dietzia lutea]|uniref:3-ketoacyl-ACP reductase n=1 Tax=Dietzia lutea TaxID=546160 RepID=A0A2S1RA13_9ACTN|nr:SDR family oxidoreductase [Dietzia lutea]AWH93066.1 hypothetical protein A6035_13810 [Dietzia lutea]AWH93104.1 hypothetical protein A6035_14015 [Dietzia lutea]